MSRGSILSDRRNNRFDRPNQPERAAKPPIVHLFAQKEEMPLITTLEQELANRSYEYRLHSDQKELKPIVEAPLRKIYVVLSMEGNNNPLSSNYKVGSNKMVRICTLGGQGLGSPERPNFQRVEDVLRAIDDFTLQEPATIRLTSVHSIKVSRDKAGSSKDLKQFAKQVVTNTYYDKAYYFKNYRGEYMPEEDKLYQDLVEQLEGEGSLQPFKSARELEKKKQPGKNRKNLVLASANESSIQVIKELKKAKVTHYHFILLGRLNPCEQYLDDSVILASSDRRAIIDFLYKNNVIHADVATRLNLERALPVGNKPESNKPMPYLQTTQSKIVPGDSSKIQEQPQKKKIRKIKSPAKGKASTIEPESPDHDTSHSSINVNIVISKHKDEPIIENQDFYTNKQGQRILKKQSIKEIDKKEPQVQAYQNQGSYFDAKIESNSYSQSRFDAIAPNIENQFTSKKASNIQSKYRNPSVIIQEMSDEYRGSNKESIMNLEPQKPRTDQLSNVNEPLQEITIKKIVNKGPTYANQPETHYIGSNRSIEYTRMNPTISESNINTTSTYQDYGNIPKYSSPNSPRVIAGSPITISAAVSSTANGASNTRVYGRPVEGYQSPSRVIRKEVTAPEEIVDNEEKSKEQNRLTFGSNFIIPPASPSNQAINYSNTLNHTNTNGNINTSNVYRAPQTISSTYNIQQSTSSNYNTPSNYNAQQAASSSSNNIQPATASSYNAQTTTSSYYTPQQTFNYHTLHNEPYNSKIHVSPGRVEQVITNAQKPAQSVRNYTSTAYNNYLSTPKIDDKGTKQFIFNSDDYEQIQRDGRIVYRKKIPVEAAKYTPINYVSARVEKGEKQEDDGSPAVKRYETSPLRRETHTTTAYDYNRSNSPTYDYNRLANNTYSSKNYEVITVPYRTDDQNLGEMIESSHKKKSFTENTQNISHSKPTDSKNFVGVSYRNEDRSGISNYYKDTGVKVYGVSHPRVEVERLEQVQPKVQASNPIQSIITPNKHKAQPIKVNKGKQDQKGQLSPALTPKNAMNESNWFSRMSQLHSDGSILRRNNIRFGVKLQKREQRAEGNSVVENKMVSGIFKLNDLNKKMALTRIIQGEEYIDQQRQKYSHINPSLNRFHFLLQEDLDYLQPIITKYLLHSQDSVESFTGVNSLFASLNAHSESFDLGFVFARQEEMSHINPALMPENYFLVSIEGEEGLVDISEGQKRVRVDQLKHFPLVQRIILDSQLYQYVAYRNSRPEVQLLADKFINSEFILEKIETAFTTEILDCYYYELPRLTRLYVLCDQSELSGLLAVVQAYSEVNPAFKPETCKLVCVLSNILGNDQLIMAHPTVTFISNPEEITHFRDILGYAHHYDAPDPAFLPIDHLYYHVKHVGLEQQLAAQYPGRFAASPFGKVAEVYSRVEKMTKLAIKNGHQPKVYLVLHESVNAEKVRVEYFTKIFMLGKAKVVQNKVVRVMNTEELLELLKK